jgi:hypothetical protein
MIPALIIPTSQAVDRRPDTLNLYQKTKTMRASMYLLRRVRISGVSTRLRRCDVVQRDRDLSRAQGGKGGCPIGSLASQLSSIGPRSRHAGR